MPMSILLVLKIHLYLYKTLCELWNSVSQKMKEMVRKLKFLFYIIITSAFINCLLIYLHPNWLAKFSEKGREKDCNFPKCNHFKKAKSLNASYNFYNRRIKKYPDKEQIKFEISVCPKQVEITISNIQLINDSRDGFHVFVFNEATGSFMAHFYDRTDSKKDAWMEDVDRFLNSIHDGRIIIILFKKFSQKPNKYNFTNLQSTLQIYRSSLLMEWTTDKQITLWILLAHKGVGKISELYQLDNPKHPNKCLKMSNSISLSEEIAICPNWPDSYRTRARRRLCRLVEGYRSLCSCSSADNISYFKTSQNLSYIHIPTIIVGINDPHYLLRVISSLTNVEGIHPKNILVFIDENYEESKLIVDLFKIKLIRIRLQSNTYGSSKTSYKFRTAIASAFRYYYLAQYVIVMEDNIDSSTDLLHYFNATTAIVKNQNKIFSVTASSNQYFCSKKFEKETYLSEYIPDTTFMISRDLWKNELSLYWPDNLEDKSWKMWFQDFMVKTNRYCLYPLVSRVFYFGRQRDSFPPVRIKSSVQSSFVNYSLNPLSANSHDALLKTISDTSLPWNMDKINCSNNEIFRKATESNKSISDSIVIKVSMSSRDDSSKWNYLRKCFNLSLSQLRSCWYKMTCMLCFESTKVLFIGEPFSPLLK